MTTKAQHTPGPWTYHPPSSPQWEHAVVSLTADATVALALGENDGKLIAAAPELLEAAKQLVAWATNPRWDAFSEITTQTIEAVEAAIAKAEG